MIDRREADTALLDQARAGDMGAFEQLVRAHTPAVYAHAERFFGDAATAEDVTQEVFVKVYRSMGSFDGKSAFSTWLYRVTRNVCLDMWRAGKRRPLPIDPLDVTTSDPDPGDEIAMRLSIETAIAALPPEDRDALNAVALFGMSYADAAEALGVPSGTVKSRVFRARRTIAATIGMGGGA